MAWKIQLGRQADAFAVAEHIADEQILTLIGKFINYCKGHDENIDVKKMKGKWKGYHRIRIGKVRIILKVDFKAYSIFVDRIDFRGNVYK